MPGDLHIVHLLDDHVSGVPTISIPLGGRVVVMRGDEDVAVPRPLGRGEHGVQGVDGPPVGEEMPLAVMRPRMVAVRILVVHAFGKGKIVAQRGGDPGLFEVVYGLLAVLETGAERTKETTGLRVGVARPAVGFPDVTVASPVGSEFPTEDVLDTDCPEHRCVGLSAEVSATCHDPQTHARLTTRIGGQVVVQVLLPGDQDPSFGLFVDGEIHVGQLVLEFLQHDPEPLGTRSDLAIVEPLVDVDRPRRPVLNTDEVDRREVPDLDGSFADFRAGELTEGSEIAHELIVLVDHVDLVILGELEPLVETLGRVHFVPFPVFGDSSLESLALSVQLLFEIVLGPGHEFGNGMLDRGPLDDLAPGLAHQALTE